MQTIPFTIFYERICKATPIATQMSLAKALRVNRSAVTQAKNRDAVPHKWILALSRKFNISPDWLEFGNGSQFLPAQKAQNLSTQNLATQKAQNIPAQNLFTKKILLQNTESLDASYDVPLISATLCAGGGSFDVEASIIETQTFPYKFLQKMGQPAQMVLMPVTGDSMEPFIYSGDTVLIDQSQTYPNAFGIYAVGVEETIFVKRVEYKHNAIVLHSDNEKYSPITLEGDEQETFRVLGKVLWLCRDCR